MTSVSVLCPSRGRGASLAKSCETLLSLADTPGMVEILVGIDPGDDETAQAASFIPGRVKTWTAPERFGYARLHEYYNALAKLASRTWLLIWNDDARMLTPGWDTIIGSQPPGVLWVQANHHHGASMFPAWPRAWAEATGHVSTTAHCDTFLQYIGEALGCLRKVPVEVLHDRADVTGGHDDATYAEGRGAIGPYAMVPGFDPGAVREQVVQDVLIIEQLLGAAKS